MRLHFLKEYDTLLPFGILGVMKQVVTTRTGIIVIYLTTSPVLCTHHTE